MQDSLDYYMATDGEIWYYSPELGLYFSSPNLVGIGMELSELEKFDSERE